MSFLAALGNKKVPVEGNAAAALGPVERKVFQLPEFRLECGKSIPLTMGYETYGALNEKRDNAVLVAHHFSATGHAAGKYDENSSVSGFWDSIIGPGKAVDTSSHFVISADNLCNIQVKNPNVRTVGPASINPVTGRRYGMDFPVVTTRDIAFAQAELVKSLGIKKLKAAMGPSLGGMVAMQLAVNMPDFVEKCIGVVTAPKNPLIPSFQHPVWAAAAMDKNYRGGDYYDGECPKDALMFVAQNLILSAYTPEYIEKLFPRDSKDDAPYLDIANRAGYEEKLYAFTEPAIQYYDFNSWIYTTRITMNHDITRGYADIEEALSRIKASVLLISNKQDALEGYKSCADMVDMLKEMGKDAKLYLLDDKLGHMAGIVKTELFADQISLFLRR